MVLFCLSVVEFIFPWHGHTHIGTSTVVGFSQCTRFIHGNGVSEIQWASYTKINSFRRSRRYRNIIITGWTWFFRKTVFYGILIFKVYFTKQAEQENCKQKVPILGNTKKQRPHNIVIFIHFLLAFNFSLVSRYLCFSHCCPMGVSDSGMVPVLCLFAAPEVLIVLSSHNV